jgi:uncharacterized OsmC-like protein
VTTTETPAVTHRNGVDTEALFQTIGVVDNQRELAAFQFRATNTWQSGTHSRSAISTFSCTGGEHAHVATWEFDADHPMVLTGADHGPTPVEYLLVALASCLTAGVANIASARGVELRSVTATVEGDMDMQGILGLSDQVRNGYQAIRVAYTIDADAPAETVRRIVAQSQARSAVFDVITNQVPVTIAVDVR